MMCDTPIVVGEGELGIEADGRIVAHDRLLVVVLAQHYLCRRRWQPGATTWEMRTECPFQAWGCKMSASDCLAPQPWSAEARRLLLWSRFLVWLPIGAMF